MILALAAIAPTVAALPALAARSGEPPVATAQSSLPDRAAPGEAGEAGSPAAPGIAPGVGARASLAAAVDAAIARHPAAAEIVGRRRADRVQRDDAGRWVRQAPTLTGRYQTDRVADAIGEREWETTVNVPITPPGERQARRALSRQRDDATAALADSLALMVAGQVREAAWVVRRAAVDLGLAERAAETARLLERDLAIRVREGERPEADLPLVQAETLAQESAVVDAEAELAHARHRFTELTGLAALPASLRETAIAADRVDLAGHPGARRALAERDRARQARRVAGKTWTTKPSVGVGMRGERPERGAETIGSLGVFVTVPLDFGMFNRTAEVGALDNLAQAERALAQVRRDLRLALDAAEHRLDAARRAATLADRRRATAEEALRLARISFEVGESDLVALLRAREEALRAIADAERRAVDLGRAIADYNQAAGVMP